ncbi:MAG: Na+/H+ antiporter NhaA [Acidimicrobiales bacterium]
MASGPTPIPEITFIGSDHALAARVGRPVRRFFDVEASGGIVLLVATAVALIWANSPWSDTYHDLWRAPFELRLGALHLGGGEHPLNLELLVNDGLMVIFFFVVGLEIKRELISGHLRNRRAAALPAIAALGGMVVPAAIFLAFNAGTPAVDGWGIPMATDIAFAVGVVSLLGNRVSRPMKVFLLTLAIVDDIGAILVIAIFYTESLNLGWLATAAVLVAITFVLRELRVWYVPLYVLIGTLLWLALFQSGVHATLSGVMLGLITPARPLQSRKDAIRWVQWLRDKGDELFAVDVAYASFHLRESVSVAERLQTALHPVSAYVIIPIFALANAGVELGGGVLGDAAASRVTWGVALGLVAGKAVGIYAFTTIGRRLPFTEAPKGMGQLELLGLSVVAGIGFTVSLFVTGLAFDDQVLIDEAKIGILFASLVAGIAGLAILRFAAARRTGPVAPSPMPVDETPTPVAAL